MKPPVYCTQCGSTEILRIEGHRVAVLAGKALNEPQKLRAVGSIKIFAYQCVHCHGITEWNERLWEPNVELPS